MAHKKRGKHAGSEGFFRRFWKKHGFLSWMIILIITVLVIIGGFQVFNYARFLLGYDLTIRLGADKNDMNLVNSQNETVVFSVDRISRIFCKTECEYSFSDLSSNTLISQGNFYLNSPITKEIEQKITAPSSGEGQKIYSFDLICSNHASIICKTDEKNVTRRTIITAEYYLSPEQLNLKQEVSDKLKEDYLAFIQIDQTFNSINHQFSSSNLTFLIDKDSSKELTDSLNNFEKEFNKSLLLWTEQDYDLITEKNSFDILLGQIKDNLGNFDKNIFTNVVRYNLMIESISTIKQNLDILKTFDLNQTQAEELNILINIFNNDLSRFEKKNKLSEKQIIINSLSTLKLSAFVNQTNETYHANQTIILNLEKVNISLGLMNVSINFTLPENKKACCLDNICNTCQIQREYPIILLHGHNFNKDISADNSINIFDELQNKLELSGYFNAGELYLYEPTRKDSGTLGIITKPIVVRASYYFDFMKKPEGYQSVQIKSENLNTYSIRLKEIIENVKYETQSPKVIVIGHSMGGLVARRYVQIFGNESIDKLILINTPNKGVTGKSSQYCGFFGAVQECEDMDSENLFINKLNNEKSDSVNIINIISEGCPMDLGNGDGVVLKDNAILDVSNSQNFFVNGTCSGTDLLHNSVLDINRYPKLFEIINESL
jgi:hypothetical protein